MSDIELLQTLAGSATKVLRSGGNTPTIKDVKQPFFDRAHTAISPIRNKFQTLGGLARSGTHLAKGDFVLAGEELTRTAASSDTVLDKAKDLQVIKKIQKFTDIVGTKISTIPGVGPFLKEHFGKAAGLIPASIALAANPSIEASGELLVDTCGVVGTGVGATVGNIIPVAGTTLGAKAGNEAATELCANTFGRVMNIKERPSTLDKIMAFKDSIIYEANNFEVSNVKSWEGIPALTPSVRELSSKNPPTI